MPIMVTIDKDKRYVHAICNGVIREADLMAYQQTTWIDADTKGFDGLFDASQGDFSHLDFSDLVLFSRQAADIDQHAPPSKMAIVVASSQQRDLADFYCRVVDLQDISPRTTMVFHSIRDAHCWLNSEHAR